MMYMKRMTMGLSQWRIQEFVQGGLKFWYLSRGGGGTEPIGI